MSINDISPKIFTPNVFKEQLASHQDQGDWEELPVHLLLSLPQIYQFLIIILK